MPGIVMHHHFACSIYNSLSDEIKNIIDNKALYYFGAFGPDVYKTKNFYSKKKFPIYYDLSKQMHTENTRDFILEMVKLSKLNKDIFPYLCGWISHYYLDIFVNPYIFNKSGYYDKAINNSLKYRGFKLKLERGMDSYIIENYYNGNPDKYFINHRIIDIKKIPKSISQDIDVLYLKTYGINQGYKILNKALFDMRLFYLLLHDPLGFKNYLLNKFDNGKSVIDLRYLSYYKKSLNARKLDIFNLKHERWTNPVNENMTSIASYFDLMEEAKNQTAKAINELYRYIYKDEDINIEANFPDLSCYTGLSASSKEEMHYFNIVFK